MKYIVYKTTNKINGKIYVGVHKTEDPEIFDGYIGCGVYVNSPSSYLNRNYHLHNAIRKYGIEAFVEILLKFLITQKMLQISKRIQLIKILLIGVILII